MDPKKDTSIRNYPADLPPAGRPGPDDRQILRNLDKSSASKPGSTASASKTGSAASASNARSTASASNARSTASASNTRSTATALVESLQREISYRKRELDLIGMQYNSKLAVYAENIAECNNELKRLKTELARLNKQKEEFIEKDAKITNLTKKLTLYENASKEMERSHQTIIDEKEKKIRDLEAKYDDINKRATELKPTIVGLEEKKKLKKKKKKK